MLRSWARRPEYLLAPPVFATRLVYIATIILLPSLLVDRGLPPEAVGALVGAYGYAAIVMDLTAGALADRFAPARLAAIGSAGVVGALALVGLAASVPALAAGRLLHGLSMGLFRPAANALLLEHVEPTRRASALGLNNLANIAASFAAPVAAGLLADRAGATWGLTACAAVAALATVYLLVVFPPRARSGDGATRPPFWRALAATPGLVRRRRLLPPLVLLAADIAVLNAWLVYLPLHLTRDWGYSLAAAGALVSLDSLAYAVAQPVWGRLLDRAGQAWHGRLVAVSLLAHGLGIAALPLMGGRWELLAALLLLVGALDAGVYPGSAALAAERVADDERGRAMGLVAASGDAGQVLGPLAAAAALSATGNYAAALVVAAPLAVVGVVLATVGDTPRRR